MSAAYYNADPGSQPVYIHLRSSQGDAINGNPSTIRWQIAPPVTLNNPKARFLLSVVQTSIPNTYYQITTTTNTLVTSLGNYTIPPGMYTIFSLATALGVAMVGNVNTWSASLTDGKLTVTRGTAAVTLTLAGSTIAPIIGLTADTLVAAAAGAPVTLQQAVNLAYRGTTIFLRSANLRGYSLQSRTGGGMDISDIIAKIPMDSTDKFGFAQHDLSEQAIMLRVNHISTIELALTDRDGVALDLQGFNDWLVTLRLDEIPIPLDSVENSMLDGSMSAAKRRMG